MADDLDIPQPNPRAFDVGAMGSAGPAPGPLTPAPQPPQPPAAPAPQPKMNPAAAADIAHHYGIGKAVKSLFGQERSYSVDETGKTVETESDAKPGQIFRHMVAGVLLGGAAAEKNKSKNFLSGLASGGGAAVENEQAQDQNKIKQAREDFKQGLEAKKDKREDQYANTQQDLMKAQIAMHNAQTLRENHLIQRESFEAHQQAAAHGKAQMQPYLDANLPKAFDGVSESEMNELLKKNPNASNLLWEPTGVTTKVGQDGKPYEELTYSAVDPKGKVKITDEQIKNWKAAGLDQVYGKQFFDVLKSGKELDAQQYMALTHAEQDLHNKSQERQKQDLDKRKEEAQIALEKAQAAHFSAEATKLKRDNKKDTDYDTALDEFNDPKKAGSDFSKLSAKSQFILGDHVTKEADEIARMHKQLVDAGQGSTPEALNLYKRWETLNSIKSNILAPKGQAAAAPQAGGVPPLNDDGKNYVKSFYGSDGQPFMPKEKAGETIWGSDLPPDQKLAATKAYGAVMPWSEIEKLSAKAGIKPEQGAEQLKAAGVQVGAKPKSSEPSSEPTVDDGS